MKRLLTIALAAGLAAPANAQVAGVEWTLPEGRWQPPAEFAGPSNAALAYYRTWLIAEDPDWRQVAVDGGPAALARLAPTVGRLIEAAAIPGCDWGVDYTAGPSALLPHLFNLRSSARLLRADAVRLAGAGDIEGAVNRLEALFRMSGHTSRDRMVISSLIGAAISGTACDATDEILAANPMTPAQARRLLTAAELPADPFGARAAVRAEGVVLIGWAKETLVGADAGRLLAQIVAMEHPEADHPILQMDAEDVARDLDKAAPFYEEAVALLAEPDAHERILGLERRLAEGEFGVAAQVLAPAITKVRESIDRAVQKRQDIIATLQMAANR